MKGLLKMEVTDEFMIEVLNLFLERHTLATEIKVIGIYVRKTSQGNIFELQVDPDDGEG